MSSSAFIEEERKKLKKEWEQLPNPKPTWEEYKGMKFRATFKWLDHCKPLFTASAGGVFLFCCICCSYSSRLALLARWPAPRLTILLSPSLPITRPILPCSPHPWKKQKTCTAQLWVTFFWWNLTNCFFSIRFEESVCAFSRLQRMLRCCRRRHQSVPSLWGLP